MTHSYNSARIINQGSHQPRSEALARYPDDLGSIAGSLLRNFIR